MPVPINQIEELLLTRGYQVVHETKKKQGFRLGNDQPIYLNKTSKTGVTALVLHPETKVN